MNRLEPYALPRPAPPLDECFFYHRVDVPGHPQAGQGGTDLRPNVQKYLGNAELRGKRVLEMGTTDGFLAFEMERRGAEVVAYDLSPEHAWDVVPYADSGWEEKITARREHLRQINNSFWFCHAALQSKVKMVYGTVYDVPQTIGPVDVAFFGSILLHLRDPFFALQNALRLTRDTVIISEPTLMRPYNPLRLAPYLVGPYAKFLPRFRKNQPDDSWWLLTPKLVQQMIGVLGFENSRVMYHYQMMGGRKYFFYTIVGQRTRGKM